MKSDNPKPSQIYCVIKSVKSGRVFDLCQQGKNQGKIIVWSQWKADHQKFSLTYDGQNCYIRCKKTGEYLTVDSSSDGAPIFTAPRSQKPNQIFKIRLQVPQSNFIIQTYCGKVLDIEGDSLFNGARVIQWPYHGKNNQLWNICSRDS